MLLIWSPLQYHNKALFRLWRAGQWFFQTAFLVFCITKEFLIHNVHCHANLCFLISASVSLTFLFPFLWSEGCISLYIWMRACCVTEITLTPAWSAAFLIGPGHRSVLLIVLGFNGPPWERKKPLKCAKKHVRLIVKLLVLGLYQHTFLWGLLFSTTNLVSSVLLRAWDWRLVVLGWATAGVGKMSPAWWSTGRADDYNSPLFYP